MPIRQNMSNIHHYNFTILFVEILYQLMKCFLRLIHCFLDYIAESFDNIYSKMRRNDVRKSRHTTYVNVSNTFNSSSIFDTKLCRIKEKYMKYEDEIEHSVFNV